MRLAGNWLQMMPLFALTLAGCTSNEQVAPVPVRAQPGDAGWNPGEALPSVSDGPRGLHDRRGVIHAHSVYSHDACDGEPRTGDEDTGPIDERCFDDFRDGLCRTRHDFVMLTDHATSFAFTEFPETLLYREERGDELVVRDGRPVANRMACPDGSAVLVMAGTETGAMAVGLENHLPVSPEARKSTYGEVTADAFLDLKAHGAVVLGQHTEQWSVEQLIELPFDGFEMFNLHQNLFIGVGGALPLFQDLIKDPTRLPHGDLVLMAIVTEDPKYLETWGSVLASGAKRTTTMGTDCHQNTFAQMLPDGERLDGYRRMMSFFTNHILLRTGGDAWNDRQLKDALRAGRLYGAFEMLGYPEGFDFHATSGTSAFEMGDEASLSDSVTLNLSLPALRELDPMVTPPVLRGRVLRAVPGGWEQVEASESDISIEIAQPGAYRAEIRMTPTHLAPYMSAYGHLAEREYVWIYSNPIYVVE